MSEKPLVSVIIPAYNAAEFIAETLDSIFAQTFTHFEAIVINDGSSDTEELELVLERYPDNLLYIKQENQGAAAARNAGLRAARGEFVAFLDADDTWVPEFLEKQMELLQRSNADIVFADALLFGDSPLAGRTFMQAEPPRGEVTAENLLSVKVTVLTSSVLARKSPIFDVGLFDESLRRGQDFDLWFRLAKAAARFAYSREVLVRYRITESGLSGDFISQLERTLAVLEAIQSRVQLTPSEHAAWRVNLNRTLAQLAVEKGKEKLLVKDFDGAAQSFKEARNFDDSWKLMAVCFMLRIAPGVLARFYSRDAVQIK